MRAFDRDLIRGRHYGQRSSKPRRQDEHRVANTAGVKVLPTRSRPHRPPATRRDVRAGESEGPDVMTGANQIKTALRTARD